MPPAMMPRSDMINLHLKMAGGQEPMPLTLGIADRHRAIDGRRLIRSLHLFQRATVVYEHPVGLRDIGMNDAVGSLSFSSIACSPPIARASIAIVVSVLYTSS